MYDRRDLWSSADKIPSFAATWLARASVEIFVCKLNFRYCRRAFRMEHIVPAEHIVSVVVPTFNRLDLLQRCIDRCRLNIAPPFQLIVVDGCSTDGTGEWLKTQADVQVITEPRREGAVAAFNRGFRASRGDYVMWLNDDAYPLPGAVEHAVAMLEDPAQVDLGMVAFYHNWHSERNILDEVVHEGVVYQLCHVRGYPYANFGLLRRSLLERIGFADDRFYFFGFDPDLSLKIQLDEGLKVIGCRNAFIHHEEYEDARKKEDLSAGDEDNAKLFEKWNLPEPGCYPDPRPSYLRMLAERKMIHNGAGSNTA